MTILTSEKKKSLVFVLGDQLSLELSAFENFDKNNDEILMMEVFNEASNVPHHPQKIVMIFSAMRQFSELLKKEGCKVNYIDIESKDSQESFTKTLNKFLEGKDFRKIILTEPSEYRVLKEVESWKDLEVEIREDTRFFCSKSEFAKWAKGKKSLLMENFYRQMRKKTGLLMANTKPVGDKWNYDHDNRQNFAKVNPPKIKLFKPNKITSEVIKIVKKKFSKHFGDIDNFSYATNHKDAQKALDNFIENRLENFGQYQDIMKDDDAFLYHSIISGYINCGLLNPKDVCEKVEKAYREGKVEINSAEGFIRQILGWREYIRGIYWLKMPEYLESNFFNAKTPLPTLYWGGETKMNCMKTVVDFTKKYAYSHHIQRLMVTGNFAMLIGVKPKELHEWYLAVYIDAFEWVELPNTIGMASFCDGGVVGTKPYAASGSYINKMSNFCKNCHYDVKQKEGDKACPFNYLYWYFLMKNKAKLENNKRLFYPYNTMKKFSTEKKKQIMNDAEKFISELYLTT